MATNIFIDTSIYLSFYAVSNDDLDQLEKLVGLIAVGRIKIIVPAQVRREWARNRDNKLAEAIGNVEKLSLKSPSIPRFMWEYEEVAELRKAMALAEKARSAAVAKAKEEAGTATTNADKLIQRIFLAAGVGADNPEILALAERRMAIGDLPGKPGSLGDRLNWEHLLSSELTDGDLHVISKDGDYFSPLDPKMPKYALYREWVEKKNGKLFVHNELKPFLSSKFPQFHFRPESREKDSSTASAQFGTSPYYGARDRWTKSKDAAIRDLEQAHDAEGLEQAVQELEKFLPFLGEADLLRICKFAADSDVFHDFLEQDYIYTFFENVIPKIYHLLERKDIEALEATFNLELHPEEFQAAAQDEGDPLSPDYEQMDLDLLAEQVDEGIERGHFAPRRPSDRSSPHNLEDEPF